MAISTNTYTLNEQNIGSWNSSDIITQLETAFSGEGIHGGPKTGLCVGVGSHIGGGDIGGTTNMYYQAVFPIATTGIGTGASFFVGRYGKIHTIGVNHPGYGYVAGDTVTLSAEDIGGSINGALDVTVRVAVDGQVSGGQGYGVTFTGVFDCNGTDRNGGVIGQQAVITIREGDTLTFVNNMTNGSYDMNVILTGGVFDTVDRLTYDTPGQQSMGAQVFNIPNNGNDQGSASEMTWTPLPGQRGIYKMVANTADYSDFTPTIVVEAAPSGISYNSHGTTSTFYSKHDGDTSEPWGILRHTVESNKFFGDSYMGFGLNGSTSEIFVWNGSGYHPKSYTELNHENTIPHSGNFVYKGESRYCGATRLDLSYTSINTWGGVGQPYNSPIYMDNWDDYSTNWSSYNPSTATSRLATGGNTGYQLDLNVFTSSIDPKFKVFSYTAPTLSSGKLRDRTFSTFFFHDFITDVWDYEYLFPGGWTEILVSGTDSQPSITFRTFIGGSAYRNYYKPVKRVAEYGYSSVEKSSGEYVTGIGYLDDTYISSANDDDYGSNTDTRMYFRDSSLARYGRSDQDDMIGTGYANDVIPNDANYNAVIKGIPLNAKMRPIPYYLPDDFVLINFRYNLPGVNIQQGDTITISGSEQYKVITGSYDQSGQTSGILFCGRSV